MRARTAARTGGTKEDWDAYVASEIARALPFIEAAGFALDDDQVHVAGERYLMSGRKLVLSGHRLGSEERAIMKFSTDPEGMDEIRHEHKVRETLRSIPFAQRRFFLPEELAYEDTKRQVLSITSYIRQDEPLLGRTLEEQFFLALSAFEIQEGVHATTYEHGKLIRDAFGHVGADGYLRLFDGYAALCADAIEDPAPAETLSRARVFLAEHRVTLERYGGFLAHEDFAPHNVRIDGRDIFLLDHVSFQFGNKYEPWARFINFMTVHNPALARMLNEYVLQNRGPEEYLDLRLMRAYKAAELLAYYASTLPKTEGDLHELSLVRIIFWTKALRAVLDDHDLPEASVEDYVGTRNHLRSAEELHRQQEIQQIP